MPPVPRLWGPGIARTLDDERAANSVADGPGNLISVTDQAQNVVEYNYDAANQLINVVQVNSPNTNANTTIYGYDANGNPIAFEDANQHTTSNVFDVLSELTQKTLPDATHTETRTYDNNGNLQTVTHFSGAVTTYTYDQLNRLLSRSTANGVPSDAPVSYTYWPTGTRKTMTDASGTTSYFYDSMNRLTQKQTPEGTLTYTYDAAGNLASMSSNHAHGVSVTYSYDDLNRLSTVVDANLVGNQTTTYSYDSASNVGSVSYPNGVKAQFTYDLLNRVTGLSSTSTPAASYTYQRGATGNLTQAVELGGRQVNWSYDGIYRLTQENIQDDQNGEGGQVTYGLDPVGNRTSASSTVAGLSPVAGTTFGAGDPDDLLSGESYDANRNVTFTGGKSFTYDSENHMMSMTATGTSVTMIYDGDGNRVAKSVTANGVTTTTYYLVDNLNPTGYPQVVEELAANGTVERQYTYGLQRIDEQQLITNAWTPSFYGYDGGGNVRNLTNSGGAITDSYEYDAFGNSFTVSGTTPNNYLYRGEQYDSDLGLYYLRARYYNPGTGRLASRDPYPGSLVAPPSLHRYNYAGSDPVNRIDPSGRSDLLEFASIAMHAVGTAAYVAPIGLRVLCMLNTDARILEALNNRPPGELTFAQADFSTCNGVAGSGNGGGGKGAKKRPDRGLLLAQLGIDLFGVVPGLGNVGRAFQLGGHVVATGIAFSRNNAAGESLGGADVGLDLATESQSSEQGLISLFNAGESAAADGVELVPGIGNAVSAWAALVDANELYNSYQEGGGTQP